MPAASSTLERDPELIDAKLHDSRLSALAREPTRFAGISSARILSRKLLTSLNCMHVGFIPSIILLNEAAASVEQYYRFIPADASAGNEGGGLKDPLIYYFDM